MNPEAPLALRLSGQLLLGVVNIYKRKLVYLFEDCNDALSKMQQVWSERITFVYTLSSTSFQYIPCLKPALQLLRFVISHTTRTSNDNLISVAIQATRPLIKFLL